MNHDCTHCIDFSEWCPQSCELAKLNRDLKNISDGYVSISYAHFLRSCMCPFGAVAGNAMKSMIKNLMEGDEDAKKRKGHE